MLSTLLLLYGLFLICCGITAVIFIGLKAKTALLSGGLSGSICLLISYFLSQHYSFAYSPAKNAGILVSLILFIVFSWRCTKTLFSIFELMTTPGKELKGKGIAFLIIGLMAIVSLVVLGAQLVVELNRAQCH